MKSNVEVVSGLERKLSVEIPPETVKAAFENAYKEVQKNAEIKGFRKGKAPLSTIRNLYKNQIQQQVVQDIVSKNYSSALNAHSLDPVNFPEIEFDEINDDKPFSFTAAFEVRPEIKIKQLEKLPVRKEKFVAKPNFVEDTVEEIRKNKAIKMPVVDGRAVQMGDIALIDFEGFVDGKPLDNGTAKDFELELGSKSFIEGFEEGVVGMNLEEVREISLKFPEQYHAPEIAGKPVSFKVTLKEIKTKVLPEVNDTFAASVGPYATVADLKKSIQEDYEKRELKRINDAVKDRLMKSLVEKNPVEVPKSLLKEQTAMLEQDMKKRITEQGYGEEAFTEYKNKWAEDFEKTAAFMIQSSFLVDKIAVDKNLRATAADIEEKLKGFAAQTGIEMARVKEFYSEKERMARLAYTITEEKVAELLFNQADVQELTREEIEKLEPKNA